MQQRSSVPDQGEDSMQIGQRDALLAVEQQWRESGISRLFSGGRSTHYCIRDTVRRALPQGFDAAFSADAARRVEVAPPARSSGVHGLGPRSPAGTKPVQTHDNAERIQA